MCCRFENSIQLKKIISEILKLTEDLYKELIKTEIKKNDIVPTDKVFGIFSRNTKKEIALANWGIKFSNKSPLIYNSRIETIKEKPFWNNLFNKNRCLIPMTSFFEWQKTRGRKIPYKISLPGKEVFFVPALFTTMENKTYLSLVTTVPNKYVKNIHNRMPVIFNKDIVDTFFENDLEANIELCQPYNDSKKMELERTFI